MDILRRQGDPWQTDTISLIKLVAYRAAPNFSSSEEKKSDVINKRRHAHGEQCFCTGIKLIAGKGH